jgi:ABC-type transport system substrate-binding protein
VVFQNRASRRQILAGAGGLAAAGLLAAQPSLLARPSRQASAPTRGGQLTVMWTSDFVSMDPIHSNGTTRAAIYDWLLAWRPDENGAYGAQPMLATAWEASDDAIVFTLREGVAFHDGSALNADVVAWNLQRMVQTEDSFAATYLQAVDGENPAEALDEMTVRLNLTRPSAGLLVSLSDVILETPIVSKKAFDDNGAEWLQANPVGTGPFKFVEWRSGDALEVVRNENYWQMGEDGEPMPYVDGVTYRVIISVATEFAEMRAGTADFMRNVPGRDVPAAKQIPHAVYLDAPWGGLKRQYFFNSKKGPFMDNLTLRQAFHHAIDREAIARALGAELGQPLPYEFVPGTLGYDDTLPFYEFDLEKAKAMVAEAGVPTPIEVRLTVHSRDLDQQQAQILQAMALEAGFNITLDVVEDVAWGEKVRINNDFEMATRQSGVQADPTNFLLNTWATEGNSAYHRAEVPGLLDLIREADSSYDPAERQRLYVEAQKLMHETAWFGYIWYENGNVLLNQRVQNFPELDGKSASWGSLREWEWWLSE